MTATPSSPKQSIRDYLERQGRPTRGFPAIKVVVRTDWDPWKWRVVSGGGAGHEPAHAASSETECSRLPYAARSSRRRAPMLSSLAILAVTGAPGASSS